MTQQDDRMTQPLRVLVVGYGPVGARFVENVLPAVRDGRMALTVVGAEADDAYNRVLVAEYAVGGMDRDSLTIADRAAADAAGARILTGVSVRHLDRTSRTAVLSTGEMVGLRQGGARDGIARQHADPGRRPPPEARRGAAVIASR